MSTELLRFTTAGSVDDGKSTLIGRLLYDSKSIFQDQLDAVESATLRRGETGINLALLTDGLRSEREQGITIDVAYRYFSTPKRKFIIADSPGHIQYTRNMVTGASTANVALVLIDARHGVVEQTRRHAIIASLLQIPHIAVCINKMDLVEFAQQRFDEIKADFEGFATKLDVRDVSFIPVSALDGDNVVDRSENMPWYEGPTLMYYLENVHIASDHNFIDVRFPVQYVIRPNTDEHHDYRGYAGTVAGGVMKVGDQVTALPSGFASSISHIDGPDGPVSEAFPPMAVTVRLSDNIDVSRGDMLVRTNNQPDVTQDVEAMVCWFDSDGPIRERGKYVIRHTTQQARCLVKQVRYKMDINTLHRDQENRTLAMNDIGRVVIRTTRPVYADSYHRNRVTGSFVLLDEGTNNTVAAGMII